MVSVRSDRAARQARSAPKNDGRLDEAAGDGQE
jgi:hypothetical protein